MELSVDETNELRAKLGLAPLRGTTSSRATPAASDNQAEEVLELSVNDTNDLRAKLGLGPLREGGARQEVHKPAENVGQAKELQERLEKARLEREVQRGIASTFESSTLGEDEGADALSWAAKMRKQSKKKSKKESKKPKKDNTDAQYNEHDLQGMKVSHNMSELDAGTTTIMTLADAPLLKTRDETSNKVIGLNEEEEELENVELSNQRMQRDGLRKKRQVELGMGRAGGYAGFDDDEFEELSGSLGPSRMTRGSDGGPAQAKAKPYGFQIGGAVDEEDTKGGKGVFASYEGRGVSLEPTQVDVTASDFMTVEEDAAMLEQSSKKKKKDTKFKKKSKKEKKNRRKKDTEEEEDEVAPVKGLLDELEATAVETKPNKRKRRRSDAEEEEDVVMETRDETQSTTESHEPNEVEDAAKKRAKFDATMAKGNARTAEAFKVTTAPSEAVEDDEPDDAFLNAALAKARRLRRLREMSTQEVTKGADAVAEALHKSREQNQQEEVVEGGMTFAVDDTEEFTRALRARAEQAERQQARKAKAMSKKVVVQTSTSKPTEEKVETVDVSMEEEEQEDIADLAKEIKEDDDVGLEGTTASTVSVGRGMANVLSMLRQTGDITGKNAGKEEMRGRAKDERTYEDYEPLNLSEVVKIGKNATDKDKEFANREIKLEYRDEHGRLLTRKEAYRNLCYQFHGHGSAKKNEERRLRQIAMEQAEKKVASRQVGDGTGAPSGSLGALKATQKATGKAFIVHKT